MSEKKCDPPVSEKLALTVAEVAEVTGLSRNTIYEEISAGRLPHRKTGTGKRGTILVSRSALLRWLEGDGAQVKAS